MYKVRETAIVLLMLLIATGALYIIYSLLVWQVLPKTIGLALLFALALLKGLLVSIKTAQTSPTLTCHDARLLKFLLLSIGSIFLVILYISFVVNSRQIAACIALALGVLSTTKALKFLPAH